MVAGLWEGLAMTPLSPQEEDDEDEEEEEDWALAAAAAALSRLIFSFDLLFWNHTYTKQTILITSENDNKVK